MNQKIDPKKFGLHPSTWLEQTGTNQFILRINRKSRIIMKDGKKIADNISKIKALIPEATVCVISSAPVCSKTRQFLNEHDIGIETTQDSAE